MRLTLKQILNGPRGHLRRMSKRTKISMAMLSYLKNGERPLSMAMAERLAKATETIVILKESAIHFELIQESWTGKVLNSLYERAQRQSESKPASK